MVDCYLNFVHDQDWCVTILVQSLVVHDAIPLQHNHRILLRDKKESKIVKTTGESIEQ